MAVPEIRLKNDMNEWEESSLNDNGSTFTGLSGKTKEDFGHGEGHFVTYTNVYSNPVSDLNMLDKIDIDSSQHSVKYGDVFFTTSSETPDEVGLSSVWTGTGENIYLNSFCFGYRPYKDKFDTKYLAYALRSDSFRKQMILLAQGISRFNISKTKAMNNIIYSPKMPIQKDIAQIFIDIDFKISAQLKKVDALKQVRQSSLVKMFPKAGEKVPEIRFKGFDGDWEEEVLSNIISVDKEEIPTPTEGYIRLGIRSHTKGTFHEYVPKGKQLETAKMYVVHPNNFIVNITFGWEHAVAITSEDDAGKLTSQRFPQFSFNDNNYPDFYNYIIKDEKFRKHLLLSSPGGAGRNRVLNISLMLEYKVRIPSLKEQIAIAKYFKIMERKIELESQKYDKLIQIKKSLLKKLFP